MNRGAIYCGKYSDLFQARQLGTTKKAIIEDAIRMYKEKIEKENNFDALELTQGAWRRMESPDKTVEKAHKAFRKSVYRYQIGVLVLRNYFSANFINSFAFSIKGG